MIIDCHSHVTAPLELYFLKTQLISGRSYADQVAPNVNEEKVRASALETIGFLDSVGTDLQIISPRPFQLMHSETPPKIVHHWVRANNDIIAWQARLYPERIQGMAALPQAYGEPVSVVFEELERSVKELDMVGVLVNPDPSEGTGYVPPMGDEYWYPLYEKLVELDVPALVHSASCRNGRESYSNHFITEESIAILSLLESRVFEDFPKLKLIISHGGGSVPYQIGRWRAGRLRPGRAGERFDVSLRRLYFDTVLYNQESLELLFKICRPDRCLFGTEKPGVGSAIDPDSGRSLDDLAPVIDRIDFLTAEDKYRIFEGNAREVFTRLRVPAAR
jgi:4-oxalmesaconate hydratase